MINEKNVIGAKKICDRLDWILAFLLLMHVTFGIVAVCIHKELHELNEKQYVIKYVEQPIKQ